MSSPFILLLIILAVLAGSLLYIIQAEGGISAIPRLFERMGISINFQSSIFNFQKQNDNVVPWPQATETPLLSVPSEYQSGNSRFSQGACVTDGDCITGGCSGEVCVSASSGYGIGDDGFFTTCEFSPDFPNAQGYSCGCVNGVCGWR